MPRIPVRHLPNNSSSLATDPRSIDTQPWRASEDYYRVTSEVIRRQAVLDRVLGMAVDEEIPNQGASERMAAAMREDV